MMSPLLLPGQLRTFNGARGQVYHVKYLSLGWVLVCLCPNQREIMEKYDKEGCGVCVCVYARVCVGPLSYTLNEASRSQIFKSII